MTSPNPMALEAKALEAAEAAQDNAAYEAGLKTYKKLAGSDHDYSDEYLVMTVLQDAFNAARALPPPAAGEGLEPVAWRWRWSTLGRNTAWHFSPVKPGPFAEEGYEVQPLYAATQAARAAVLEEALAIVSVGIEALDGGVDAASRRYAAAIRALKEKT